MGLDCVAIPIPKKVGQFCSPRGNEMKLVENEEGFLETEEEEDDDKKVVINVVTLAENSARNQLLPEVLIH